MSVLVTCPTCSAKFPLEDRSIGELRYCAYCGNPIEVPVSELDWLKQKSRNNVLFKPLKLTDTLHDPPHSSRKKLLLMAAWMKLGLPLIKDDRSLKGIDVLERYAEGLAELKDLESASTDADAAEQALYSGGEQSHPTAFGSPNFNAQSPEWCCTWEVADSLKMVTQGRFRMVGSGCALGLRRSGICSYGEAQLIESWYVRDVFGNPFRPVAFDPEWRTSTAILLAEQMYSTPDFSAMPILADALQDAGCDSDEVLNHCRHDGPHIKGCWVVDLVLGKL